jgi:AcrR family transcriptional regulator
VNAAQRTPAGRSEQKRGAVLDAAAQLFLRDGFLGTSMDEVAALAEVSKQTLYKHFGDKEGLFREVIEAALRAVGDTAQAGVTRLGAGDDLEADLLDLAVRQLTGVMQPRMLELRRLIIAEANRFPDLGRAFHARGLGLAMESLTAAFQRLARDGRLQISAPATAATQFNWLLMSEPINRVMMLGTDAIPTAAEIESYAATTVRAFMTLYLA